jgi:hypothetical protein
LCVNENELEKGNTAELFKFIASVLFLFLFFCFLFFAFCVIWCLLEGGYLKDVGYGEAYLFLKGLGEYLSAKMEKTKQNYQTNDK